MKKWQKILLIVAVIVAVLALTAWIFRDYLYVAGLRLAFTISDTKRDKGLTSPEDVLRMDDIAYGEDAQQVMDVYMPAGTQSPLPTIVSVHGGGYAYGDKALYQYYCMSLAQRGYTVVNFSYRLAPGHRYPAPLEDVNAVMRLVCERAEEFCVDLNNVFMVGDSAGAQLCSQYCAAVTNPEYAALLELDIPGFELRAAGLNCGLYQVVDSQGSRAFTYYFTGGAGRYADALDLYGHITADYPPCYIMSSTGDSLRPYAQPLGDVLTAAGVENEVHIYGDDVNKPGHVFHLDVRSDIANRCNDEECAFFARHIAGDGEGQ